MPTYRISVINHTFCASDDHELPSFDDARKQGIGAALAIGVDEIIKGKPFFGAEVRVQEGEKRRARFVVSVGASELQ